MALRILVFPNIWSNVKPAKQRKELSQPGQENPPPLSMGFLAQCKTVEASRNTSTFVRNSGVVKGWMKGEVGSGGAGTQRYVLKCHDRLSPGCGDSRATYRWPPGFGELL